MESTNRPRVGLTMGDVAGIGPEVIARAWVDARLHALAQPLVIGDPEVLKRAVSLCDSSGAIAVEVITAPEQSVSSPEVISCLVSPAAPADLRTVLPATVNPRAGRAAYEFLTLATDLALAHGSTRSPRCPSIKRRSAKAEFGTLATPRSWPSAAARPITR